MSRFEIPAHPRGAHPRETISRKYGTIVAAVAGMHRFGLLVWLAACVWPRMAWRAAAGAMMDDAPSGLLRKIVTVLDAALIPHMIVGSFASTAHGEPRTTREWAKQGASDRQLEDVAGILRVRGADLDFHDIERWITELGLAEPWQRATSGLCAGA